MLASSGNGFKIVKMPKESGPFIAELHLKMLLLGKKPQLNPGANIEYGLGWKEIVDRLFFKLKGLNFTVLDVYQDYGQLDVDFEVLSKTHELRIWRAVHAARRESRHSCSGRGEHVLEAKQPKALPLCRKCERISTGDIATGTWLDE